MIEDGDTMIASIAPFSFLKFSSGTPAGTFEHNISEVGLFEVLNFITKPEKYCTETVESDKKTITLNNDLFANKYEELHTDDEFMFIPYEKNLFEKIVWPLKNAKLLYILDSYIGTIALCGLICEMMTLLIYEIYLFKKNDTLISNKMRLFEKKRQSDRIGMLRGNKIPEVDLNDLDYVRETRNKYIHEFCVEYENIKNDAKSVYMTTHKVLHMFVKPTNDKKSWEFSKDFIIYLEKKGCIQKRT